jgi:hypothetical protein
MGSKATPVPSSPERKSAVRMLALFAVIGLVGVLMFKFSVVLGLIILVVAEVFFAMAYRRFSKRPPPAG